MLYGYNLSLVKEPVLYLYELCRASVPHFALKTPLGAPSSFLHPVKFLVLIFMPLYSLKLACISAIISYKPPWDASSTQNFPLLITAGELISTPVCAYLHASFSSQLLSCSVNLKRLLFIQPPP